MSYQNHHVRYERNGDKVTPVRITKRWVHFGEKSEKRRFMTTRCTVTGFGRPNHGPDDWSSSKAAPLDRKKLMEQGLIRPPGYEALPCLELDDPATWKKSVVDKGPPWADEYEEAYGKGTAA